MQYISKVLIEFVAHDDFEPLTFNVPLVGGGGGNHDLP